MYTMSIERDLDVRMKTEDSRVTRTREILVNALIEPMQDKDAERITVAELVRKAGVSRSTFYLHYTDMSSFLEEVSDSLVDDLMDHIVFEEDSSFGFGTIHRSIYRYLQENKELFRTMIGPHGYRRFRAKATERIQGNIAHGLREAGFVEQGALTTDMAAHYIAAAHLAMSEMLMEDDYPFSADALSGAVTQFFYGGILPAAGISPETFKPRGKNAEQS